ncbi:hypothetical protein CHRY9390_02130 [Chryseobacterium aquaeductus]|uniref:Uncharacterized protein n=1 Tax=Chryseobacterium aquaeductus TaxID=2675056 RepID=A0A9N8MGM9_9FLAO|nr:hypothetical protein CHRY9390_02130 [Chryseobacterium potabilaquae]CAD7810151.1 hypothetical protein CHRY9390_02130 [Chryseobacterium aquaeductus]
MQMLKKLIIFKIELRLLLFLIIAFIFTTAIGTVSHEYGHFVAAKFRGINMQIHYAYTSYIYDGNLRGADNFDKFIVTLGGPIQTMLTGTLGLILLFIFQKNQKACTLNFKHWFCIFLSLFWLRQTANFTMWMIGYLLEGKFSTRCDEIRLAKYLELPNWSIILSTAFLGFIITMIVIFKFIPVNKRFTFIIAGFAGGISGYMIWLELLGKIIMP